MRNFVLNKSLARLFTSVLILVTLGSTSAFAQCDYTLACNDVIQLSLANNCQETVTPDMILENPEFDDIWYIVTVTDENGDEIPGAVVDGSHIGQVLTTQITLIFNNCNLTCWGTMFVEDKLPPIFTCPADVTIPCGDDTSPASTGNVTAANATDCSGVGEIRYTDVSDVMPCSDIYSDIITRTWSVSDVYGNVGTCQQRIFIMAAVIGNVMLPDDYIVDCEDLTVDIDDLTPEITGMPTLIQCSNIQYFFTDLEFDLCGSGLKIRREWHVLDWCTGEDLVGYQTIKVEDTAPPLVQCGTTFFDIPSNVDACYATYTVPLPNLNPMPGGDPISPTVLYDCSDITFTIAYAPFPEGLVCEDLMDAQEILEDANLMLEFIEIIPNADGEYIIEELPLGCNWIQYTFDDGCGNQVLCTKDVFVTDNAPPSAICEGYTTVTVDHTGWAHMNAESLDDHSWDHCDGPLIFTARRIETECSNLPEQNPDDLDFDEYLHFCCEDVGTSVLVELKVMDEVGNYNFCQTHVYVDDKTAPVVVCPPSSLTLDCSEDYEDLMLTGGEPSYSDNCIADIYQTYTPNLNDCGIGSVTIRHFISDNAGNEEICTQNILIRNTDPLTADDVDFPDDIETSICSEEDLTPEALNSYPDIDYSSPCADPAISWSDLKFYDTEGACYKIVRTWTVVDWCAVPIDYFNDVQKILVADNEGPTYVNCEDQSYDVNEDCEATINYIIEVSDNCTPNNKLDISWTIENKSNNQIVNAGANTVINDVLEAGEYEVNIITTDECDNNGHCSFDITITDEANPTPICRTEVVWVMDDDGTATVWASDFDFKSFDGCDEDAPLYFSFDAEGNMTNMSFDCDDLPDGMSTDTLLQMYVTDADGNYDFCYVTLVLQDNGLDACQDAGAAEIRVEGAVYDLNMEGVENIHIGLHNMTNFQDSVQMTSLEGEFVFSEIDQYDEYMVKPERDVNYLNGVSTLDLVLIQKHILGQQAFESPYQMIAADVNKSESVTGIDLVEIRKLILGIYDEFPAHTSWDFVSMNLGSLEVSNPWVYTNEFDLGAIEHDMSDIDFVAVKIGDVNGNAVVSFDGTSISSRSDESTQLIIDNKLIGAGELTSVNVQADNSADLNGFQLALDLSQSVELVNVNSNMDGFSESNWSLNNDVLIISWNNVSLPTELDFELELRSTTAAYTDELLTLNSDFVSEAYSIDNKVIEIELDSRVEVSMISDLQLTQNNPNPFNDYTVIDIFVPENGNASFSIQDLSGKIIYNDEILGKQGHTQLTINSDIFNSNSGVYFYSLKNGKDIITKKMFFTK